MCRFSRREYRGSAMALLRLLPGLLSVCLVSSGCAQKVPPSTPTSSNRSQKPADTRPVEPPNQPILFQPMLIWQDAQPTQQGTGFLAKAPGGKVVGVTSGHFLNRQGP